MSRLIIDTNILLLYIVGSHDRARITQFKRTNTFDADDFDLLTENMRSYESLVVTPAILTEVSNLLPAWLHVAASELLIAFVKAADEHHSSAESLVENPAFPRIGFTDSSILDAAAAAGTTVLTDDAQLYHTLVARGYVAVNFNHLRRF